MTIDFFGLNERDVLLEQRAKAILLAFALLENPSTQDQAEDFVSTIQNGQAEHANCLRSYLRAYESDRLQAAKYFEKAAVFLATKVWD